MRHITGAPCGAGLVVIGVLLFVPAPAVAQTNPFAADPHAAEAGKGMFRIHCSPCHGIKGQGGRAPDLTTGTYSAGDSDAALFSVIANGVSGTEMPDYEEDLGTDNLWRVVSYLRSITERRSAPAVGEAAAGEKLFWETVRCGQCHRIGTRGGRLGPDLSRVGRNRSLSHLRQSLVEPNADLTPRYAIIRVVTRDGSEVVGVERGIDNFSVQLMDPAENFHSFFRSDVRSVRREFRSLMPDDYGRRLGAPEIDNLVAYLASLRGTEKPR